MATLNDDTEDYTVRNYQDDLTTDPDEADLIMIEEGEDPSEELGIPPEELAAGLDDEAGEGDLYSADDARENIEDIDDDDLDA